MATSETIMIGDTMETDIQGGVQMGYKTILVLSGGSSRADLAKYAFKPDLVINSVADLDESAGLLHEILPTMNREDDTPHDLREWAKAHA